MSRFDPEPVLAGLKRFQRATVEHVVNRLYRDADACRRFLVADETGLGKSVVARGVIARAVEHLQDDDKVGRIDVIYVCSNTDIARQNLSRLRISDDEAVSVTSRLTLLALHSRDLTRGRGSGTKPFNLVAFTPGTSFDKGWRTGRADERALLFLLLSSHLKLSGWDYRAGLRALQATSSSIERFKDVVDRLQHTLEPGPDPVIVDEFARLAQANGLHQRFLELLADIGRRRDLPRELKERARHLTGELRTTLAKSGIRTLEPDLIILDEFQRFRHLLSVADGGESAELAHHLFDYEDAKVLLLSATPYKPFTLAEEAASGEDHHRDFLGLLQFLNQDPRWHEDVGNELRAYRNAVVSGLDTSAHTQKLRELLLKAVCRTERPQLDNDDILRTVTTTAEPTVADVLGYHGLRRLAKELDGPATVEYWKSAPYFVNFMEGYLLGDTLRAALKDDDQRERLAPLLARTQHLSANDVRTFAPIDFGSGRLRALADATVGRGQEQLLWVPPSLPYYPLRGPFAQSCAQDLTKRLVFSSWNATPTAVAALLSYEAERRLLAESLPENTPDARKRVASRLDYRLDGDRPATMSTLALFWPHPGLAQLTDSLAVARSHPQDSWDLDRLHGHVGAVLSHRLPAGLHDPDHPGEPVVWRAFLRWPEALPDALANQVWRVTTAVAGAAVETSGIGYAGLSAHVRAAASTIRGPVTAAAKTTDEIMADLVSLSLHAPGNTAWRSLSRLLEPGHTVSDAGHWVAAATLASGLRALFNRIESAALLDKLYEGAAYWRAVLRYCSDGCLQAVLDEYLHHLKSSYASTSALDDADLLSLAETARQTLSLRASTYQAFDPEHPDQHIGFTSRFALRYGARPRDHDSARPGEVRNAFNSPFWPFVLTTTSAGQEGIDFHWWSHAVVHWNTPANPVDFEQREGRVHRYGGHVIRKNIAHHHRQEILASNDPDPWEAAYRIAGTTDLGAGEFAPHWIYPGPSKVQRHLLPYPLSRDITKTIQLKDSLALYRLAFGQPRQEDLVELLQRHGGAQRTQDTIDLRPDEGGRS